MAVPTDSISKEYYIQRFKEMGALWKHSGDPRQPHAELTGGKHSDGFFNGGIVMENPALLREMCLSMPIPHGRIIGEADRVVDQGRGRWCFLLSDQF